MLSSNGPTEGFYLIAKDKKYDLYLKGADLLLEQRKNKTLWLIPATDFNTSSNAEMYIDTAYFKNTSESPDKELVIRYSLYRLRADNSGKSTHLLIIDLRDRKVLLNIALYDHRLEVDENGKPIEYLYEADVKLLHDRIVVTTSDDSDINDARTQLDDGIYFRRGHCFVSYE